MPATLAGVRRVVLLTGMYLVGVAVIVVFLRLPGDVPMIWPASGIGLAIVLRYGLPYLLIIPIATVLRRLLLPSVPPALFSVYLVTADVLATLLAVSYIRRRRNDPLTLTIGDVLLLQGTAMYCAISTLIGTIGMVQAGMIPISNFASRSVQWFMSDLLGITSMAPLLLCLFNHLGDQAKRPPRLVQVLGAVLLIGLTLIAVYFAISSKYPLALASLPVVLLLWAALRFPQLITLVCTTVVILSIGLMLRFGLGGFEAPKQMYDSALLMSMLVMYSVVPVLLLALRQDRDRANAALQLRVIHDPLTGLLNRTAFENQARDLLGTRQGTLALIYTDLDHFKLVNDSASHAAGDEMIRCIAALFRSEFGAAALIARTGGDEFAVLAAMDEAAAKAHARNALASIEKLRLVWQGQNLGITASAGIAISQPPHQPFDELLSYTDAACFAAKEMGGNRCYAASSNIDDIRQRTRVMQAVHVARQSLDQGRLALWCQPIVDLRNPVLTQSHFEVLVRLLDAEGKVHLPAELVIAAERYRLGPRLDRYVVEATLEWLEQHPEAAARVQHCGINIGGATLADEEFGDFFSARLRNSPLRADQLCLEITETSVVGDMRRARAFISRTRDLGCCFALDDFGTGFSSFSYLRELDVDYIKVDGSFVRSLESSGLSESVVRSTTEVAHVLGKRVIAEQVETEVQLNLLRKLDVDYAQGFVFAKAKPIKDFFGLSAR